MIIGDMDLATWNREHDDEIWPGTEPAIFFGGDEVPLHATPLPAQARESRPWSGPIDTPVSAAKPRNGARPWAGLEEPTGAKRRAERENRAE